jgi:hypothetical protein
LFLYADGGGGGIDTDAYADVSVQSVPTPASLAFVATSESGNAHPPVLTTADSTYGSVWTVAGQVEHVQVNGMMNGWLTQSNRKLVPYYTISSILTAGVVATIASGLVTLVLAGSVCAGALLPKRRRRPGTRTKKFIVGGTSQRGSHAVR